MYILGWNLSVFLNILSNFFYAGREQKCLLLLKHRLWKTSVILWCCTNVSVCPCSCKFIILFLFSPYFIKKVRCMLSSFPHGVCVCIFLVVRSKCVQVNPVRLLFQHIYSFVSCMVSSWSRAWSNLYPPSPELQA